MLRFGIGTLYSIIRSHQGPQTLVAFFCQTHIPAEECLERGDMVVAEGIVKWFNEKRGYGFISMDEGQDVFVHYSSILGTGFKSLYEGQRVRFEVEQSDKGPQAVQVETV